MASALKVVDVVKKFSGDSDEDVEQWLDRFQTSVQVATQQSDKAELEKACAQVIPLVLTGSAYKTWKRVSNKDKLDDIVSALRAAYGLSIADADRELQSLRLIPGGKVDTLAVRAEELLKIISGGKDVPEQFVSLAVLRAVPARIADEVHLRHGKTMGLDDVMDSIKSLWRNHGRESPVPVALAASHVGTSGRRSQESPGPQQQWEKKTAPPRCFGCRRLGHIRRDCTLHCFNCGDRGHFRRDCPKDGPTALSGNGPAGAATPGQATPAER